MIVYPSGTAGGQALGEKPEWNFILGITKPFGKGFPEHLFEPDRLDAPAEALKRL